MRIEIFSNLFTAHIRRTDKSKEADPIPIENYMTEIEDYFDIKISEGIENIEKKLFLATDEPDVIDTVENKYSDVSR